jgi:hypothetical protein
LRGEANSRETNSSRTPITAANNPRTLVFRQHFYLWPIPGVPRQLHKPRVFFQNNVWVALLGRSIEEGIAGFGSTVEAALAAFDAQYEGDLRSRVLRDDGG